jgi:protein-arginine kinase activator protein McsA
MKCKICEREIETTQHHLIPRCLHKNQWFKKNFAKEDMEKRKVEVCKKCHMTLHDFYDEKYLGKKLNTLKKILKEEKIINYIKWARKQK